MMEARNKTLPAITMNNSGEKPANKGMPTGLKITINTGLLVTILMLSLWLPQAAAGTDNEWRHLFTRDGIDVYRKSFSGTRVCAFKGVGFVDAEMAVVDSVLQNISAYPQWVERCRESVVLKEIDRNTKIIYNVVDTPPPFKDRDVVLSNKTVYDRKNGSIEIFFDIVNPGFFPSNDRYFRVSELSGKYLIEPFSQDKTRVTFVYQGDPGGNIPVTIANWAASRYYPHSIIMGLRSMVKKQKCLTSIRPGDHQNKN